MKETNNGTVLIHCHAGCDSDTILKKLGLAVKDLFPKCDVRKLDKAGAGALLRSRGLRRETIEHFRISSDIEKQAWQFPLGQGGGVKFKRFESAGRSKYWVSPGTKPGVYYLNPCRNKSEAWLVEGEADVWIMHQAGLDAFSFTGGAANVPAKAVKDVANAGIGVINIAYDNDDKGQRGAQKAAAAFSRAGIKCTIRELPTSVGAGGDITTLYNNLGADDAKFRQLLGGLPESTAPATRHSGEQPGARPPQAQQLVELVDEAQLFHSPDSIAFATIPIDDHHETHAILGTQLKRWLRRKFYGRYGKPPNAQALSDAVLTLDARASYDGEEQSVFIRLAEADGALYVDLGDQLWRGIEITPEGWHIVHKLPVKFQRAPGMQQLPVPMAGGSIEQLREFVNVGSESDFRLLVGYTLAALSANGPYWILMLLGEQGSAKSTAARVLRTLIDPSSTPIRGAPREERDLVIAANNGWVLAFDNLSTIKDWLSDALCRIATGGGFSTRKLYTDSDEVLFNAQRPIILTAINDPSRRDDLRDRTMIATLPPIQDHRRISEKDFWESFNHAHPFLFGALLDGLSAAVRNFSHMQLDKTPRMADAALWVTAAEEGLGWNHGAFLMSYDENRQSAVETFVEDDLFGSAILDLVSEIGELTKTCGDLQWVLDARVGDHVRKSREWPKSPRGVRAALERIAPALRRVGVEAHFHTRGRHPRPVTIRKIGDTMLPTVPEAPAAAAHEDSVREPPAGRLAKNRQKQPRDCWDGGERSAVTSSSSAPDVPDNYELLERAAIVAENSDLETRVASDERNS